MKKPKAIALCLIFVAIMAPVYLARLVSFNLTNTGSAGYIDAIVRGFVFINSSEYEGVNKWDIFPLWPAHANCKPWLPQEIWRECNAIVFDAPISDDEIVEMTKKSIEHACSSIEVMSTITFSDIVNNYKKYTPNLIDAGHVSKKNLSKLTKYFSCHGGAKRREHLYIYRQPIHPPGEGDEKPFAVIEFYH